jgi:hypothetical protein
MRTYSSPLGFQSTICNPSQLSFGEGKAAFIFGLIFRVVATTKGIFWYQVLWILEPAPHVGINPVPSTEIIPELLYYGTLDYLGEPVSCYPSSLFVTPGIGELFNGVRQSMGVRHLCCPYGLLTCSFTRTVVHPFRAP